MIGGRLAEYEITSLIGKGGMGEVYRARDPKLKRDVAIKVLPDAFASDAERIGRFEREAEVLAALNHSSIAGIYDFDEANGRRFIVMEYIEGETIAEHLIRSGPLPLDEALRVMKQVAEALEAAHERGIIHRDLKPANIKITSDGKVKVLDFGLAKIFDAGAPADPSHSPTLMSQTMGGAILGTAAYMSPEQARGKIVDKRADIWGLGCVLYETLTGKQPFPVESVSETLAGIIKGEPDWTVLPAETPRRVRSLLQRCLRKNARERLHDAADFRIEIDDALASQPDAEPAAMPSRMPRHRWLYVAIAFIAGAAVASAMWWARTRTSTSREPIRLAVPLGAGARPFRDSLAVISPDGKTVVYSVLRDGIPQFMIRGIHEYQEKLLPGTEDGAFAFFSPDSRWLGFWDTARRELKKVPISGGSPERICAVTGIGFVGASWGPDDRIVFVPGFQSGIWSVSANSGEPQLLLNTDVAKDRINYGFPQVLPNGKGILFTIGTGAIRSADDGQIAVLAPGGAEPRIILQGGTDARYLSTGHLIYARGGALLATRFDLSRTATVGTPVPVIEHTPVDPNGGRGYYSISDDGTLLYLEGDPIKGDNSLVLADRSGRIRPITENKAFYQESALSRDGQRAAVRIAAANDDLWILDVTRGTPQKVTSEAGDELHPVWTPDGARIAFGWRLGNTVKIVWKAADATGDTEELSAGEFPRVPASFSPDGKTLAFVESHPSRQLDIWMMPLDGDRKPQAFATMNASESAPQFSRDGRWIAYESNDTGQGEIYVQPFASRGGGQLISAGGGYAPVWSHKGSEVFYLNGTQIMSAAIDAQGRPAGTARVVVDLKFEPETFMFDVMPDDNHFLMSMPSKRPAPTHYNIILNWFTELQRLVPAR